MSVEFSLELVLFPPLLPLSGGKDELSSVIVPIILVLVLAYVVAATFLGVYKLAIDTILVCFCEDLKVNNGSAVRVISRIPCVQRRTIACVCLWPCVWPCRTSVRWFVALGMPSQDCRVCLWFCVLVKDYRA